jgi:hypothetical protein
MSKVFVLKCVATGKVLDSAGDGRTYTMEYNHGNHQKWDVQQSGKGYAYLRNVATGLKNPEL